MQWEISAESGLWGTWLRLGMVRKISGTNLLSKNLRLWNVLYETHFFFFSFSVVTSHLIVTSTEYTRDVPRLEKQTPVLSPWVRDQWRRCSPSHQRCSSVFLPVLVLYKAWQHWQQFHKQGSNEVFTLAWILTWNSWKLPMNTQKPSYLLSFTSLGSSLAQKRRSAKSVGREIYF